jgi:ribosome-associated translation inhibitor RaiA
MRILLKSLGFSAGETFRQHVTRRLQATLSHWTDRLGQVVVRLVDVNGSRGGLDKACSIQLQVLRGEPVVVTAISSDYDSAVDLAIRRAGRAASRTFDRRPY